MNHKHTGKNTHSSPAQSTQAAIQSHTPGLLATGLKTSLESHKSCNESERWRRRCYKRGPNSEAPYPEGEHCSMGWGEVKSGQLWMGQGPGFLLKPPKWKHRPRALIQLYGQNYFLGQDQDFNHLVLLWSVILHEYMELIDTQDSVRDNESSLVLWAL